VAFLHLGSFNDEGVHIRKPEIQKIFGLEDTNEIFVVTMTGARGGSTGDTAGILYGPPKAWAPRNMTSAQIQAYVLAGQHGKSFGAGRFAFWDRFIIEATTSQLTQYVPHNPIPITREILLDCRGTIDIFIDGFVAEGNISEPDLLARLSEQDKMLVQPGPGTPYHRMALDRRMGGKDNQS